MMTGNKTEKNALERGLGLKEAVALNMIEMVGIGPFVVIPLVIKAMGGPQALLAWVAGALLALLDGFVWSELGAAMPLAGGSYVFLREAYGPGRLVSTYAPGTWNFSWLFFAGLASATVNTIYPYWGYYNICHLGGEIREPEKNIPRGIFISTAGIAVLYLVMQTCILGVLPWQQAQDLPFIVSAFVEKLYGPFAAWFATLMILWIAFASLFSSMLGYSRVPYSAALDGNFFRVFARVHPKEKFPHISLLFLGALTFVFSLLFKLKTVITAVLAMRLIIQFIGQAVGVMLLRRRWPPERLPFKMWLYPLPALLTIVGWLWLFSHTGSAIWWGLLVIVLGLIVFLVRARIRKEWPFGAPNSEVVE